MAKQKISNIAKELNVGLPNIFEFLRKHNIEIVESPNSRVEDSVVAMLTHHFQPDRELKTRSDQQTSDRRQLRADARAKVTVNSDNMTVSDTWVGKEFALLSQEYGLTKEEAGKLLENAEWAAFGIS